MFDRGACCDVIWCVREEITALVTRCLLLPRRTLCGTGPAWNEPLLVAVVPKDETPGVHKLRLSSLDRVMAGHDDHCVCSVDLEREEVRQATGTCAGVVWHI